MIHGFICQNLNTSCNTDWLITVCALPNVRHQFILHRTKHFIHHVQPTRRNLKCIQTATTTNVLSPPFRPILVQLTRKKIYIYLPSVLIFHATYPLAQMPDKVLMWLYLPCTIPTFEMRTSVVYSGWSSSVHFVYVTRCNSMRRSRVGKLPDNNHYWSNSTLLFGDILNICSL